MKLNKLFPTAFVALLAAGGLVGCGGGEDPNHILIWAVGEEQAVLDKLAASYNDSVDDADKITFTFKGISEADAGTEVRKDATSANAPDLFLAVDDHLFSLQGQRCVLDISESPYADGIKTNNVQDAVDGSTYDNHLYGFPVTNDNGYFLWYNSSILTSGQVGSLESILQNLPSGKQLLFDVENGYYLPSIFLSKDVCGLDSCTYADTEDGVKYTLTWDNSAAVASFTALRNLCAANQAKIGVANNTTVVDKMISGEAGAAIFGPHVYTQLKAELGNNLQATKLPTLNGKQLASLSGSKVYLINGAKNMSAEKQARVAKFADYITNKESQLVRFETRGTIPCNKAALQDTRYTSNKPLTATALELQKAAGTALQAKVAEASFWDPIGAIGDAALNGLPSGQSAQQLLHAQCQILRGNAD